LGRWTGGKIEFGCEKRRAIAPILATVLTVAIAVLASLGVSGFVFGTVSLSQVAPQIAMSGHSLVASAFGTGGGTTTFTCTTTPSGAYLFLSNSGGARGTVAGVTIGWAGTNNAFTLSGACTIGALGSPTSNMYITFPSSNRLTAPGAIDALSGQTYTGTITLSDGVKILFTGIWE